MTKVIEGGSPALPGAGGGRASSSAGGYVPSVHYLTWLTAATVFPLIWAGGLVTTTKAGMAVPDWPGTYGYNMFLYPWTTWFFGPWDLFIEHGHRLLGSLAGIWCILLVVLTWIRRCTPGVRTMALIALGLVILQGVMGGVRVLQVDREIARIHGCLGPAFFAFLAALMVVTSRWWQRVSELGFWIGSRNPMSSWSPGDAADLWRYGRSLWVGLRTQRQLTWAILGLAYGQLVLGASMRHVPETADPAYFRVLVWFHVVGAACVAVTALALTLAPRCPLPGLAAPRRVLLVAVGLQILLGLGTWVMKYSFPAGWGDFAWAQAHLIVSDDFYQVQIVTAHVAVGSLILAVATFSGVRLWRAERCLGHWLQWAEVPEEAGDPELGRQPSFDGTAGEAGENVPRPVAALTE